VPSLVKKLMVKEFAERFERVEDLLVINYCGISAEEMVEARRELRRVGVDVEVVKNRLAKLAFDRIGLEEVNSLLDGPSALVTGGGEGGVLGLAKLVAVWGKKAGALEVLGGYSGGKILSNREVARLSRIPSLKGLQTELVVGLVSPVSGLAGVLEQLVARLVYALDGIKDQKESSA